jgi:hypothetical protein
MQYVGAVHTSLTWVYSIPAVVCVMDVVQSMTAMIGRHVHMSVHTNTAVNCRIMVDCYCPQRRIIIINGTPVAMIDEYNARL